MVPRLVMPATAAPITLERAMAFCRIDDPIEAEIVEGLIEAAARHIEAITGRALGTQTWEVTLPRLSSPILLPIGPLQEVVSVTCRQADGSTVTLDLDSYAIDAGDPAMLIRRAGAAWPAVPEDPRAVTARYVTGYDPVPAPLQLACLLLVGHWYINREAVTLGSSASELPHGVEALIANYRSWGW